MEIQGLIARPLAFQEKTLRTQTRFLKRAKNFATLLFVSNDWRENQGLVGGT
jgi:hypothetical protein